MLTHRLILIHTNPNQMLSRKCDNGGLFINYIGSDLLNAIPLRELQIRGCDEMSSCLLAANIYQ